MHASLLFSNRYDNVFPVYVVHNNNTKYLSILGVYVELLLKMHSYAKNVFLKKKTCISKHTCYSLTQVAFVDKKNKICSNCTSLYALTPYSNLNYSL